MRTPQTVQSPSFWHLLSVMEPGHGDTLLPIGRLAIPKTAQQFVSPSLNSPITSERIPTELSECAFLPLLLMLAPMRTQP